MSAIEPRWTKISSAVLEALEAGIAIEQNKIFLLEAAEERFNTPETKPVQEKGEGAVEFTQRLGEYDRNKKQIPKELIERRIRLRQLMGKYEEFLKGKSILGEKAGAVEAVEQIFNPGTPAD